MQGYDRMLSVSAIVAEHQRAFRVFAGCLPRLELVRRQQIVAILVPLEVHVLHRFARSRFHMDRLPVDAVAAAHRIAGKLIHDFTVIVHDDLICEFLPDELSVAEVHVAAGVCDAGWRIRAFVGNAAGQEAGDKRYYGIAYIHRQTGLKNQQAGC